VGSGRPEKLRNE
jgi:hypothetical protein